MEVNLRHRKTKIKLVSNFKTKEIIYLNHNTVEVNGQGIEDVDRLVYLGATVSKKGRDTQDIHSRVVKARGVFMRLKKIWSCNSISQ